MKLQETSVLAISVASSYKFSDFAPNPSPGLPNSQIHLANLEEITLQYTAYPFFQLKTSQTGGDKKSDIVYGVSV
jgi:hypothetical protein